MEMKNNPLVSVVIPVYNAEKYLAECVESLLSQSYTNIEVLLVDDGSTDRSEEIYTSLAKTDQRVRILKKENGGVSSARNLGIKSATGDFIMFVDSDDWLESKAIEEMVAYCVQTNADLCVCDQYYKDNEIQFVGIPAQAGKCIDAFQAIHLHLRFHFPVAPWLSMARLDKVRNCFFDESIHALEDWEYNLRALTEVETVCILRAPYYHYRTVIGSASKSSLNARKLTCFLIPERIQAYFRERNLPFEREAQYVPIYLLYHMLVILANGTYDKGSASFLSQYARKHLKYALTERTVPLRQRIYTCFAAINPRLFCMFYWLKHRG